MKQIIKRDGRKVPFDKMKIVDAVLAAFTEVDGKESDYALEKAGNIADYVADIAEEKHLTIEEIQDIVEKGLMATKRKDVAKAYVLYRNKRDALRKNTTDNELMEMLAGNSEHWNNENSNKNATLVTTQRDYMAGIISKDISERYLIPYPIIKAHNEGIIHFHDMDYFGQNALNNCCLINLEDMLQNGTNINGVHIDRPHRFVTAMTVATQIITAVASSQYGGTSITLTHLAPFVADSRNEYYAKYRNRGFSVEDSTKYALEDLKKEINDGVQTFNYQINSMSTTNGQAPFITVFMYLGETDEYKEELAMIIEEFLHQRIKGMKNEKGVYVTQSFPKLIYALEGDNIKIDGKYRYLTELSAKCSAKRLVPDYISEKKMKELKEGNCYPSMGCRSFLSPWKDSDGKYQFYGRFNQGVVTLNLIDVALSSKGDINVFWNLMEERTELCHEALLCRHKRLENTLSDVAPILWQDGAFARLDKHETIDTLLHNGYSSISLGYAGLYECVKYLTGVSHTTERGKELGLKIMKFMNDKCDQWNNEHYIGYSIYGTPIESTTYKFAKCLKERFGNDIFIKLDGKDRNYITNSYHIPVFEDIDAFSKLSKEAEFQNLSLGGAISYVEIPNMQNNLDAVMSLIEFIYDNVMYAELNTKSDYCQVCGYDGEIEIVSIDNKYDWRCPQCGNMDHSKLNITRRTCGYLGSNFWNQGRTEEIKERVLHL